MRTFNLATIVALLFTAQAVLAVPPDSFGFPESETSDPLIVVYHDNSSLLSVEPGDLFGINVPAQEPQIAVNGTANSLIGDYDGAYVLFMLDPDARFPENPTLRWLVHWWQLNMTKTMTNDTNVTGTILQSNMPATVEYLRPMPPTNSSAHRYVQYLFAQPDNFEIPEAYSGYNSTNRTMFPFEQFLSDAKLNSPVAANYFYCSNESAVPPSFVAPPGAEYPGGNGAMVTQGTNNPSSTGVTSMSSSASATGSMTASASSSTYTGAADKMLPTNNVVFGVLLAISSSWILTL